MPTDHNELIKYIKEEQLLLENIDDENEWSSRFKTLQNLKKRHGLLDDPEPEPPPLAA